MTTATAATAAPVAMRIPPTTTPTPGPSRPTPRKRRPEPAPDLKEYENVQVLPPPQVLQVHRRGRGRDRLQGSQHPAPVHHRDRQDRAEPHHRHQGKV